MHLVHKDKETGALGTVLGIIFDVEKGGDKHNDFIASLNVEKASDLTHHHVTGGHHNDGYYEANGAIALQNFLEGLDLSEFYYYPGSLTTPPCTEGINWLPLK